jgi:heat shock protein HspQ
VIILNTQKEDLFMADTRIKFSPGDIVKHEKFHYRGVIFDVDLIFEGSEEWYEQVALSRPPKDAPWYHVLVDGSKEVTYVAERHIALSDDFSGINHPLVKELFTGLVGQHYQVYQQ